MRLARSRTTVSARHGLVGLALAIVLAVGAGCGDDTAGEASDDSASPSPASSASTSPPASPSQAGAPTCEEIWVDGSKLPKRYSGCNGEEGFVAKDALACSSGQFLVRHDERFYGVLGGQVHVTESQVTDDDGYRDALARCRG